MLEQKITFGLEKKKIHSYTTPKLVELVVLINFESRLPHIWRDKEDERMRHNGVSLKVTLRVIRGQYHVRN